MAPRDTDSEPTWRQKLVNVVNCQQRHLLLFPSLSGTGLWRFFKASLSLWMIKLTSHHTSEMSPGTPGTGSSTSRLSRFSVDLFPPSTLLLRLVRILKAMIFISYGCKPNDDVASVLININLSGLQHTLYKNNHESCFFVWNSQLALDYLGKPLTSYRFLWYPSLSPKSLQPPVLKPVT